MFKKIPVFLLLLMCATPSFALNKGAIEQKLNIDIKTISPTPIKGILEVITEDKNIFYIDSTGKYLLVGNMIDADKRINLTGEKLAAIRIVDFKSLPLNNAVKTGRGAKKIA
ncbi:MAG: disulfide isomerase DsbC N-terminal domain-containing protein, partial [Nitrospinota bacterium]